MIVDLDDFHETNHRLDLLHQLHDANPAFRCTLFAVPALGSDAFWASVPEWCELAVHGWYHGDPPNDGGECAHWNYGRTLDLLLWVERHMPRFVRGFKAPGWKISDGCFLAVADHGWWIADQHLEDTRRPAGLRTYFYEGDHACARFPCEGCAGTFQTTCANAATDRWHGHIQNVCGNGLEERFDELLDLVRAADSFQFASEAVVAWA